MHILEEAALLAFHRPSGPGVAEEDEVVDVALEALTLVVASVA